MFYVFKVFLKCKWSYLISRYKDLDPLELILTEDFTTRKRKLVERNLTIILRYV